VLGPGRDQPRVAGLEPQRLPLDREFGEAARQWIEPGPLRPQLLAPYPPER
jgi:hypothetical protein